MPLRVTAMPGQNDPTPCKVCRDVNETSVVLFGFVWCYRRPCGHNAHINGGGDPRAALRITPCTCIE
jgi:hypothetical protein